MTALLLFLFPMMLVVPVSAKKQEKTASQRYHDNQPSKKHSNQDSDRMATDSYSNTRSEADPEEEDAFNDRQVYHDSHAEQQQQHQQEEEQSAEKEVDENASLFTDYEIYDMMDQLEKHYVPASTEAKGSSSTAATTFYGFLGIPEHADDRQISQAFRRRSVQYHPDKHPGNDHAAKLFSLLGNVSKLLRHPGSRARYDWLVHEAPAWHRSTHYSVRRYIVRTKFNVSEVFLLVLGFLSIAQILGMLAKWAVDWLVRADAKSTLKEMGDKEYRKMVRKIQDRELDASRFETDTYLQAYALVQKPLEKPKFTGLLACQVVIAVFYAARWMMTKTVGRLIRKNKVSEQKSTELKKKVD